MLYGTVVVDGAEYPAPAPSSVLWRPDRITVIYEVAGMWLDLCGWLAFAGPESLSL